MVTALTQPSDSPPPPQDKPKPQLGTKLIFLDYPQAGILANNYRGGDLL